MQLYRAERNGTFPKSLKELVPKYLTAVPTDPMSMASRPLGYAVINGSHMLYSVGDNGVDDIAAGTFVPVPADEDRANIPDLVYFLNHGRPAPAASGP